MIDGCIEWREIGKERERNGLIWFCVNVCKCLHQYGKHYFLTSQDRVVCLFAVLQPWRPSHGTHSVQYWHQWIGLNPASSGQMHKFKINTNPTDNSRYTQPTKTIPILTVFQSTSPFIFSQNIKDTTTKSPDSLNIFAYRFVFHFF